MRAADGEGTPWRVFAQEAEARFAAVGIESPEVSVRRIIERAAGFDGAEYALGLAEPASERAMGFFDAMVERRLAGEPLQYVLGEWSFRTLDLMVDRRVLIPRPETEQVVEVALAELDTLAVPSRLRVADLGTGSGAIALSVAVERPAARVWAGDVSADALAVARANLAGIGHAGTRVTLVEGSWFDALPRDLQGTLDLVISNPPYVVAADPCPPRWPTGSPSAPSFPARPGSRPSRRSWPAPPSGCAGPGPSWSSWPPPRPTTRSPGPMPPASPTRTSLPISPAAPAPSSPALVEEAQAPSSSSAQEATTRRTLRRERWPGA